jgi:DNA-binding transcriptional LysR family regulator
MMARPPQTLPHHLRLRNFEVLLAVAGEGSMQRAAQRVNLTQPAITKIVQELEAAFGAQLFARSKRGVTLTESGSALAAQARILINDLGATRDRIAAIDAGTLGSLHLGVLPVVESSILPKCLQALRRRAPDLHIRIEEGTRAALLGSLSRAELDCVIGRLAPGGEDTQFRCEPLVELPVRIVCAPRHPLAAARRMTLSALARYPWVLPRIGAPIRTVIDSRFVTAGLAPPLPRVESTSIRLNYELIRGSDMIGVMTADAADAYAAQKRLHILPLEISDALPHVGVIMRQTAPSNALRLFTELLRAQWVTSS